jgi:hypothetical protein
MPKMHFPCTSFAEADESQFEHMASYLNAVYEWMKVKISRAL